MSYDSKVLALSPIAYWPMQETSGTTMTAATGNNGSYANGPTLAVAGPSAKIPNAVSFDGSNDYASAATEATTVPNQTWAPEPGATTKPHEVFVAIATNPMQVLSMPRHWVWLAGAWQRVR